MVTSPKRWRRRKGNSGQTMVEYLMLIALAAVSAVFVITGPVKNFTNIIVATFRSTLANVVQNGEILPGDTTAPGEPGHPSHPSHARKLH